MATIFKQLTNNDIFTDTTKLTAGIFANGAGQLAGSSVYTASISSSNNSYYYTIQDKVNSDASAVSYFDVFFGSANNYGSNGNAAYGEVSLMHIDHPNTTSQVTYKIVFHQVGSGGYNLFVNRSPSAYMGSMTRLILMEIAV